MINKKPVIQRPWALKGSIALSFAAGAIGSVATTTNIETWYVLLKKPAYLPPNWVFAPVWATLYILMGIALYLVIVAKNNALKKVAYCLFGAQLVLNALWSLVFFGAHALWPGVAVVVALFIVLVATTVVFAKIAPRAAYLLVPYVAWVGFASYLTIGVAVLN